MDFTGKRITPDEVITAYIVTKLGPMRGNWIRRVDGRVPYYKDIGNSEIIQACAISSLYLLNHEPVMVSGQTIREWAQEKYGTRYVAYFVEGFDSGGHNSVDLREIEAYQDGCECRMAIWGTNQPTSREVTAEEFLSALAAT